MVPITNLNLNTSQQDEENLRLIDEAIINGRTFQQIPPDMNIVSAIGRVSKKIKVIVTAGGILGVSGMIYGGLLLASNDECSLALRNKGLSLVFGSGISLLILTEAFLAKVFLSFSEDSSKEQ